MRSPPGGGRESVRAGAEGVREPRTPCWPDVRVMPPHDAYETCARGQRGSREALFGMIRPCRHRLGGAHADRVDGPSVRPLPRAARGPRTVRAGGHQLRRAHHLRAGGRPGAGAPGDDDGRGVPPVPARCAGCAAHRSPRARARGWPPPSRSCSPRRRCGTIVADGDGLLARRPVAAAARRVAAGWDRAGARTGAGARLRHRGARGRGGPAAGDRTLHGPGGSLLTVTEPTETATAAAFAHTAVLAGRPANAEPLAEAGRLFGRLAHLLDAVEDLAADEKAGAWNPVAATGTDLAEVRRLCDDAVHGVRLALREAEFVGRRAGARAARARVGACRRAGLRPGFPVRARGVRSRSGAAHARPGPARRLSVDARRSARPSVAAAPRGAAGAWSPGCAVWSGLCCTGQVCCRDPYEDPWTGKHREGWCHKCDCDCCDCGCGECCDKCSCCECDCCDCG